jgi:hypothetical protein
MFVNGKWAEHKNEKKKMSICYNMGIFIMFGYGNNVGPFDKNSSLVWSRVMGVCLSY